MLHTRHLSGVLRVSLSIGLIVGWLAWPTPARAESEPNDSSAQADSLAVGLAGADISASINPVGDSDYYAFTAEAGRTYVIETFNVTSTANNRATGVWLYSATNVLLKYDDWGANGTYDGNARITYTFATGGTYFILVKASTGLTWSGTYSVRILPKYDEPGAAWNAANDNEPNDVSTLANAIDVGLAGAQTHNLAPHAAYATFDSDHDFYRFTAEAGRTYVIETFNVTSTANNRATGVWLYSATNVLLEYDDWGANGTYDGNARITYTFATSGTYYILVKDSTGLTWSGTYSLRILPKYDEPGAAWNSSNDSEPNDELVLSNLIEVGAAGAQTHQLAPHTAYATFDSDHDYYRFTAEVGRTYLIETFGVANNSTGLFLYDSQGTALANDQYGSNGSGSVDARITRVFNAAGTYIVLVKDRTGSSFTGPYSVRVCADTCAANQVFLPYLRR